VRATFPAPRTFRGARRSRPDGTFKPFEELLQLYKGAKVVDGRDEVIALLPHWRAVEPHVVRAQVPAGREEGA